MFRLLNVLFVCLAIVISAPAQAQDSCLVVAIYGNVNIRTGPGTEWFGVADVLATGESLPAVGQNSVGDWYAVPGSGDDIGWVAGSVVDVRGACADLPIIDAPPQPAEIELLVNTPVLPTIGEHAREIFAQGQQLGNNPDVFTKVGDCNTDSPFFLAPFDLDYYDLGPYDELQPTIDYFAGWFAHESQAGQIGYNAHTMLNSLWADPELCRVEAGEGPLACEYRLVKPSAAVMMFGPNDMLNLTEAEFAETLRSIVELSLDSGVIPILTTFTWHRDARWHKALAFNAAVVEVAQEYDVPLINLWRAAQDLPNYGLMTDYTHLTDSGPHTKIVFTGEEEVYGHPLRNLLTLQVLDMLRTEMLDPAP